MPELRPGARQGTTSCPVSLSSNAPSSTRACSSPTRSAPTTTTSPTRASSRPLALVHQRFSTNTFPSWPLAHPYRMVAHNGEINTLRGNVNWMAARQASIVLAAARQRHLPKLWPISYEGQSDTACFDNALELLVQRRLLPGPCHDDADPGSLGRQHTLMDDEPQALSTNTTPP
ncbi:MAG: hypothetical protein ACWGIK_24120 [Achromobacter pulmonis]